MEKNVNAAEEEIKQQTADAQQIIAQIQQGVKNMQELGDEERKVLIDDYNERNKGIAHLTEERATEELMLQTKKDFEAYQSEYMNLSYEIADSTKALDYAKWLKDWNENWVALPSRYWIGCLKFVEVIDELIKTLEKAKEDGKEENLTFDYSALTYTFNLMMGPVGFGVKYATWMAENQETYNDILERLNQHMETISLIKKKIGLLQQRWAMACQGFVCEFDIDIKDLNSLKNLDLSGI